MDLIAEIQRKNQLAVIERLNAYHDKLLVCSHIGDESELELAGLQHVRASSIRELLAHGQDTVVFVNGELMGSIAKVVDVLGVNMRILVNVPGLSPDPLFIQNSSGLPSIDYVEMVGDIADQRFLEENMSQSEIEASKANSQLDRMTNSKGAVKRLEQFNFDGDKTDVQS